MSRTSFLRMPVVLLHLAWLLLLAADLRAGATRTDEQSVFIFGNRRIAIVLPEGFGLATTKDERGLLTARIADRAETASLELTFVPDSEGKLGSARGRMELMVGAFQTYVEGSVEQAMQFEELQPRVGAGTYCSFTDAKLVGRTSLPPGEYHHATAGVKAWSGVGVVFTLFSNALDSREHQALLALLRASVEEKVGPLK